MKRARDAARVTISGLLPTLLWAALYLITQACPGGHFPGLLVLIGLLQVGDVIKRKYNHYRYFQACLLAISEAILILQLDVIRRSPCFSIMVDGSTDVSTEDHLLIYIKYLVPGTWFCLKYLIP